MSVKLSLDVWKCVCVVCCVCVCVCVSHSPPRLGGADQVVFLLPPSPALPLPPDVMVPTLGWHTADTLSLVEPTRKNFCCRRCSGGVSWLSLLMCGVGSWLDTEAGWRRKEVWVREGGGREGSWVQSYLSSNKVPISIAIVQISRVPCAMCSGVWKLEIWTSRSIVEWNN